MSESLNDQVRRLTEMQSRPWGLSDNDKAAIAMTVRVLSVIEHCDKNEIWLESYVREDGRTCLRLDAESEIRGTLMECFSEAGRALE